MARDQGRDRPAGGLHRLLDRLPHALFSVRWRFSLVLSLVILLSTAVCILTAVRFLQQTLTDNATKELRGTMAGTSAYLEHERDRLLAAAELLSAESTVKSSLNNRVNLITKLTPYYAGLNVDILDVVDARGRVVVNMEDTNTFGGSAASLPDVHQALAGREWVGLVHASSAFAGSPGIRAAVPIQGNAGIVGAVVVGRRLDSPFAMELGRDLSADVNLILGDQRTGSTETDSYGTPLVDMVEPSSLLARMASGRPSVDRVKDRGHPALSGLVPLHDAAGRWVAAIEIVRPLDSLYNVINALSALLLGIGIAIVIGWALLALYLGHRLTRRLLTLETMASEVVKHADETAPLRDLPHALPAQGRDEVASLARSFDAMMTALDERMAANARLYEASEARVNELTKLAEVARLLTAAHPIEETLDTLSFHVCRLVGCRAAAIYVPDDHPATGLFGSHGLPDAYARQISSTLVVPAGETVPLASQAAFWSGQPAWRLVASQGNRFASILTAAEPNGWGAATAVPLRLQGRTIGVLTCYTREPAPLAPAQMSLLTTVADQVAVAVENARLYAQARDMAALEERARLARELHDSVTQALFSMTMHTRAAQVTLEREGPDARQRLEQTLGELGNLTRGALAEMRALIFELRPNALAEEGLSAAIEKHSAAVSARENLPVDVYLPDSRIQLDPACEEHLYRLAQEALHNAVKHAQATRVQVRLWDEDGYVFLEVADDGVGFDPAAVPPGHLGLQTMTNRMEGLGGAVEIRSAPGQGTTIRAAIPLPTALRRTS